MTTTQKILLSFGLVAIFSVAIYLLIVWFLKSRKQMKKNKMATLGLVIKYKTFKDYLGYQILNKEQFYLYFVSLDRFSLLVLKYDNNLLRSLLRKTAKDLSVMLPFGGKVAQLPNRDTFVIYSRKEDYDEISFAESLKQAAKTPFYLSERTISNSVSVSFIEDKNYLEIRSIEKAYHSLIQSRRLLGEVVRYNGSSDFSLVDYQNTLTKLETSVVKANLSDLTKIKNNEFREIYPELLINDLSFTNYLMSLPPLEQSWANLWLIEKFMLDFSTLQIESKIVLPILLSTLENENFVENIEEMIQNYGYSLEFLTISLKPTKIKNEQIVIKNILLLSNRGVKISFDIEKILADTYASVQLYNINRLEITENLLSEEGLTELLYFASVNHLDVLLKTTRPREEIDVSGVTHLTTKIELPTNNNKNRQRKG